MSFVSQITLLCSHFAVWSYYCMECEKTCNYKNRQKCESDYTCSRSKEKKLAYTSHPTQYYARNVLEYLATVPVSTITNKTSYVHVEIHVKSVVTGLLDRYPITSANRTEKKIEIKS